jgi:TonB-linked SusC/RagA family outer membrane protein
MKTNLIKLMTLCFIVCIGVNVNGQNTISGIIDDAENGEPIIGATILKKGTADGTISDIDGSFSLNVASLYDTIEVSYVGYKSAIIPIAGRQTVNVSIMLNSLELDEVVVVGYGRQKKREVTGAIARVSEEDINSTPTLRVEQALQGRTPGVQVTNQSGQPGDEPTVRVRGIGTTGNARPLYIVDGLPVGGIDYLNPGDIETIDVLKDAASAAIYGARAANGVVLITTKSGKAGKLNVGYSSYFGVQNVGNTLDMLNAEEYKMMMNEGARNAGLSEPFDLNEISPYDTDWQEALFYKNAPMQNHQISVTGGGDKSTFASSLSYFTQEGIIGGPKSQFERYTARLNSSHKVNKILSFGNNLAYTHLIKRGIGTNQSFNGAYSSALNLDPLTPVFEDRPSVLSQYPYSIEPVVENANGDVYGISNYVGAEVVNPLALLEIDNDGTRKDQLVGNVYGELEPIKDLKFRSSLGIDLAYLLNDGFRPLFFLNGAQLNDEKTSVSKNIQRYFTWQLENTLAYEKEFGDHNVSGLLGMTASEFKYEDLSGFNAKVPTTDPNNVYLNQALDTVWTANGGAAHSALYSLFTRANYSYKNKYSVTTILRRDGSSKFGSNKRFGIFPSVGVAWVASDESFLQNLGPVNYLKLRAAWGVNGNQEIGDYQFVSTINQTRGYTFGNGQVVGASPSFIENSDIHWEESEQLNFGVDLALFENRMQATFDYYVKETKDLLERIPIPGHVGNDGPVANVGSVQNKGLEWALNWRNTTGKIKYSIGVNGAFNANKMTFIGNTEKVINGASWAVAGAVTRSEEGLPIAYFWGYKTDGIFQNQAEVFQHINQDGGLLQKNAKPGDVRFVDYNGDGIINENDRTQIGNPTPDMTFGFTANIEYSNFDMSLFLQGTYGNDVFNGTQRQDLRYTNRTTAILDRWTGEGTSTTTPRYTWSDTNNNYRVSDLYIEDGSFVRLKNIQIGYSLPKGLLSKVGAENWRFYVSGENLLTFTKYTGVDPEIGAFGSFDIGIDRAIYPQAQIMRFGTSVTF